MEQVFNIAGAVLAIYFIIAMLKFFGYQFFKKGSLKKSLLHVLISVLLFSGLVAGYIVYNKSESHETVEPGTFTQQMKKTLDTKSPSELKLNDVAQIAMLAYYPMAKEDQIYLDKIKKYYVYYHLNADPTKKTEEALSKEFDDLRVTAEMGSK